ncbi:MAG: hypothetical protein ACRDRD_20245 [Pseudonocardiaceae bacterium]
MPAVYGIPADSPCVYCGGPTVAYAHTGVEGTCGRVCARHANELAAQGHPVAGDTGNSRNWGDA